MARIMATSGFIYIWLDRKHKRYYIGSHWGLPDDGYICSSRWMRKAYKRRPQDFRRRVISIVTTTRKALYEEECRWLDLIKQEELGKKYYNLRKIHSDNHWSCDPDKSEIVLKKMSDSRKGKPGHPHTPESRQKLSDAHMGKKKSEEHIASMSRTRIGRPSRMKGKQFSEEARANMGGQNKGKIASDETRAKMSSSLKGQHWYTDSVSDCRIRDGEVIPEGFRPGRVKGLDNLSMLTSSWKDPKYRQHMSDVHKKTVKINYSH